MFVFGSVTMIWKLVILKLVQVACLCILFQNENEVKDVLLLWNSRSRQIMSYTFLVIIFLKYDFQVSLLIVDCVHTLLQVTLSHF